MERPARWRSVQSPARLKELAQTRVGKLLLGALALAALVLSFSFLGPYLAIPVFLLFGLGVPILLGWKAPRQLAVLGLAALLLSAPLINYELTGLATTPSPVANSATDHGNSSNGAPVLANATASPFRGPSGSVFTFTVQLYPNRLPSHLLPDQLWLYVSTCPGATGNSSPFCGSGYAFYPVNQSVAALNVSPSLVAFHLKLPGPNIWWWQMGLLAQSTTFNTATNKSNTTYQWLFLSVPNAYGAVQGPITGTWTTTFDLLLPQTVLEVLFYPGTVFFLALLFYVFLKGREARRKAQRDASATGTIPPTTGAPPASTGTGLAAPAPEPSPDAARRAETSCPKCGAVVYPNEAACWKCGAALTPAGNAPLKSGGA
jgi:hypothetical protein